jgi:hypothetical protein
MTPIEKRVQDFKTVYGDKCLDMPMNGGKGYKLQYCVTNKIRVDRYVGSFRVKELNDKAAFEWIANYPGAKCKNWTTGYAATPTAALKDSIARTKALIKDLESEVKTMEAALNE